MSCAIVLLLLLLLLRLVYVAFLFDSLASFGGRGIDFGWVWLVLVGFDGCPVLVLVVAATVML
jgi:hypothetical protein